jgi:hypothetical protein
MATIHEEFDVDLPAAQVYTVVGGRASHHNASAQVVPLDGNRCRFVWITDLLPDALAPAIAQMAQRGAQAMRATLMRSAG